MRDVYRAPLTSRATRRAVLALERLAGIRSLPRALPRLSSVPRAILAAAEFVELDGAGHFRQEDAPEAVTAAPEGLLSRGAPPAVRG